MKSLTTLLVNYHSSQDKVCGIRLGRYFCNKYVRGQWPELFYCEDEDKCIDMITQYLEDTWNQRKIAHLKTTKICVFIQEIKEK